jgi:ferritin-like protein
MTPWVIPSTVDTVFQLDYSVQAEDMRGLYEKAKRDQWNASRDIDWTAPADPEGRILDDQLIDIYGSPIWERMPGDVRRELNRRIAAWRLSVLMYGEQGAMLACSQLVDVLTGPDEKFFQATQVMDEARHNEVLSRYIDTRLGGLRYPMPQAERELFEAILGDSRWYIKTIALQLVAETFAVALFKMLVEAGADPVLREMSRRILQDESRHMAFGMLTLPGVIRDATAAERREMEDFTCMALERVLKGFFPLEAFQDVGMTRAEIDEVRAWRREVAAKNDYAVFRKFFRRDMHGSMVANLARIGLLTERVRPRLAALGVDLPAAA